MQPAGSGRAARFPVIPATGGRIVGRCVRARTVPAATLCRADVFVRQAGPESTARKVSQLFNIYTNIKPD